MPWTNPNPPTISLPPHFQMLHTHPKPPQQGDGNETPASIASRAYRDSRVPVFSDGEFNLRLQAVVGWVDARGGHEQTGHEVTQGAAVVRSGDLHLLTGATQRWHI
eukprot:scaffold50613_cov19-Prasinocladus_malaysianus.AAC.1